MPAVLFICMVFATLSGSTAHAAAIPGAPYRGKSRAFLGFDDPAIPAAFKTSVIQVPGHFPIVVSASDSAVWMSTVSGLKRYDSSATPSGAWQYFGGRRWLPDDDVVALAPDKSGGMWVRTRGGVSHIEYQPATLEKKADVFERRVRDRHDRFGLVAPSVLTHPGDLSSSETRSDDNDGLWTSMYAAAECFRYAATQSPEAIARAKKSIEAVLFLEQVTGTPGFPARSYVLHGAMHPGDGEWFESSDGKYTWKGDTSSDEIVGHFFIYSVATDLLPDAALKQRVAAAAARILDRILADGYTLTGPDGQPTTWGKWSQRYFETPGGRPDSPLNALELLSFLKSAAHIAGNAKYEAEYRKVALDLGYAKLAARYAELDHEINYSDEELAMLSFYSLFRYEKDPALLAVYREALAQWWRNMQREKNPLWTFIYSLANPNAAVDLSGAQWMLERIPIDLIDWTVLNSARGDVALDGGKDRFGKSQTTVLLPADERPVMKWNGNPFVVDGGDGGATEDDGAFFLLPYWLGRHQGFIAKP